MANFFLAIVFHNQTTLPLDLLNMSLEAFNNKYLCPKVDGRYHFRSVVFEDFSIISKPHIQGSVSYRLLNCFVDIKDTKGKVELSIPLDLGNTYRVNKIEGVFYLMAIYANANTKKYVYIYVKCVCV